MSSHRMILSLAIIFSVMSSGVRSEEIKDELFQFRFTVPDGFVAFPNDAIEENLLYRIVEREPSDPPVAIQILRMRGTIDPNERLTVDNLRVVPGVQKELSDIQWNGLTCQVMRTTTSSEGVGFVCYGIQFPLPLEAMQMQVCGPESRDAELKALFHQSVASFVSALPIDTSGPVPIETSGLVEPNRMSAVERDKLLFSGVLRLILVILFVAFVVVLGIKIFSGSSQSKRQ